MDALYYRRKSANLDGTLQSPPINCKTVSVQTRKATQRSVTKRSLWSHNNLGRRGANERREIDISMIKGHETLLITVSSIIE